MTDIYVKTASGINAVKLSAVLNEGSAGTIHHVYGLSGTVAKIYKNEADRASYQKKIESMLGRPPNLPVVGKGTKLSVQLAWPTEILLNKKGEFVGFLMPEVDFSRSQELINVLQKGARKAEGISEFYGFRVLLAANLSALMAELHRQGHFMIDMKPENMRFYPDNWHMAIIDVDGFSIKGEKGRIPAEQFSADYIAPEAKGKKPHELGISQDLFALAVIIFRLMNNGVHPYQGVKIGAHAAPTSLQERIDAGLYAYGLSKHRRVSPSPASIHESFEMETRELFDRAFSPSAARPTAIEWRNHLKYLLDGQRLVPCRTNPEHGHFSAGCGFCGQEKSLATMRAKARAGAGVLSQPIINSAPSGTSGPAIVVPATPLGPPVSTTPPAGSSSPTGTTPAPNFLRSPWVWAAGLSLLGLLIFALSSRTPTSAYNPDGSAPSSSFTVQGYPDAKTFLVRPGEGAVSVNVRAGPGTAYTSLDSIPSGAIVSGTGQSWSSDGDIWIQIYRSQRSFGFIKGSLLVEQGAIASPPAPRLPDPAPSESATGREATSRRSQPTTSRSPPRPQTVVAQPPPPPADAVLCILPDGQDVMLSRSRCRDRDGVIYSQP